MADAIFGLGDDGAGTQIAVGANGLILKSTDGGASWVTKTSGTTNGLYGVIYGGNISASGWVVVGQNGLILISTSGDTWTTATTFTGQTLYGVAVTGDIFLAVGAAGVFGLSADLGATWEAKSSGVTVDLYSISASPSLYSIVGDDDTVIIGTITSVQMESYIREDVALTPTEVETGTFQHVMTAAVEAVDGYNWESEGVIGGELQYEYLYEYLNAFDYSADPIGAFGHVASESFDLLTTFIGNAGFRDALSESFTATSSSVAFRATLRTILETVTFSEVLSVTEVEMIIEALSASATATAGGIYNLSKIETLSMKALLVFAWAELIAEGVTVTDTSSGKFEVAVRVVEKLVASGAVGSLFSALITVAIALEFTETLEGGKGGSVSESVTFTSEQVQNIISTAIELEQVVMTTTPSMTMSMSAPIAETLTLDDTATLNQILQQLISEGVVFDLSFGLDGDVYAGWVMNTENFAVSEYQNYPFNSFAEINKQYYGANGNGIYLLEGSDDAGTNIDATFTVGKISFGNTMSRADNAYLALRSDGAMLLKTVADDGVERWYELESSDWTLRDMRVKMGRGVKSRYWQFTISNVDGANFEVDELVLLPIILKRR